MKKLFLRWMLTLACLVMASGAHAAYSSVFIFGDSLSDSGNNALALSPNVTPVPISGNGFVPSYPYASGSYTNGPVWAEIFASSLGLSAAPSLLGGTNYAFGGARTGPISPNPLPGGLFNPFPPSVQTQTAVFLLQYGNVAPGNALYVVASGGNDAREALDSVPACGFDLACIGGIIQSTAIAYATYTLAIVTDLKAAGAQNIIVWDTPDLGKLPAVLAAGPAAASLGTTISSAMNAALASLVGGIQGVELFDLFGLTNSMLMDPAAFGLTNVTDACAQFIDCDPSKYLFWDGIHPTSAGHQILASAMLAAVPEPAMLALFGIALAGLVFLRRRRRV
ncbi:MAG: SGNH/GDSL hydrolase family protein [Pseudomonadota bacterium]